MALYNEILVGRFNRYLQKLLGMKGGPPAPQLASEIMTVLPIWSGVEDRYLQSWDMFGSGAQQGSVALQNSALRLRNPVGSNVIAVVEALVVNCDLNSGIQVEYTAPGVDLASTNGLIPRDTRGRTQSTIVSTSGNNVALGLSIVAFHVVLANTNWAVIRTQNQELVINPGRSLDVKTNSFNGERLGFGVFWRERFLEDSERA